ncbi:hypothetical protein CBR_g41137 [Chara braunii]|uniref:Kinesin-like protein n=1 Tax=Chara braunii TaxID=69332 RepID=A0A388LVJ7_CHABU|nr:hypothetical protein CBR_g41137 [Chara braunii]|eukprot:GBG86232.1 hypothetical protein CBR_g41137 [Chara braunii]
MAGKGAASRSREGGDAVEEADGGDDKGDKRFSDGKKNETSPNISPRDSGEGHSSGSNENFKVVIRVRPPIERELENKQFLSIISVQENRMISVSENVAQGTSSQAGGGGSGGAEASSTVYSTHTFTFDHVYDQSSAQVTVYDTSAKAAVLSCLKGYNATIIAYGQTGTGKTYTMEGRPTPEHRGIIPRSIEDIFNYIENDTTARSKYLVRAAYLQIYNEAISDLLKPERTNMSIREDKKKGVYVDGLSEWVVRSPAEVYGLMERGAMQRATGSTKANELSSRSHAVFIIIAENSTTHDVGGKEELPPPPTPESAKERLRREALTSARQSFRVGKLNLVDLAGSERVRTTGATGKRLEESKKINQSLSCLGNVISALTETKGRQHIPYRDSKLTRQVEEQKRRAEQDKLAAITELEEKSKEFMNEKLEKQQLEQRITNMQSQLLIGGHKIEDTPAFRSLLQAEHRRIRTEYETRLAELERERHNVEEDKAQVDRYKQLLLKQRDIMIALTARLNERDEQILVLQEELEAYDHHQRALEDQLDQKTAELIHLRKAAMEYYANTPNKTMQKRNSQLIDALGAWGVSMENAFQAGAQVRYRIEEYVWMADTLVNACLALSVVSWSRVGSVFSCQTYVSTAPVEPESQVAFTTSCMGGEAKQWVLAEANAAGFEDIGEWAKTLTLKQFLAKTRDRFLDKTTADKAFDQLTSIGQKHWTLVEALSREVDRLLQVPGLNLQDSQVLYIHSRALPEPIRGHLVTEAKSGKYNYRQFRDLALQREQMTSQVKNSYAAVVKSGGRQYNGKRVLWRQKCQDHTLVVFDDDTVENGQTRRMITTVTPGRGKSLLLWPIREDHPGQEGRNKERFHGTVALLMGSHGSKWV